jgi:hypothetical protein
MTFSALMRLMLCSLKFLVGEVNLTSLPLQPEGELSHVTTQQQHSGGTDQQRHQPNSSSATLPAAVPP